MIAHDFVIRKKIKIKCEYRINNYILRWRSFRTYCRVIKYNGKKETTIEI